MMMKMMMILSLDDRYRAKFIISKGHPCRCCVTIISERFLDGHIYSTTLFVVGVGGWPDLLLSKERATKGLLQVVLDPTATALA
jgi:hypothetical protein